MEKLVYIVVVFGCMSNTASMMSASETTAYLQKYGYLSPTTDGSDEELHKGLMMFQRRYNLEETGTMTIETEARMSVPRCGFRDVGVPPTSTLRFSVYGVKWFSNYITYSYLNYSADVTEEETRQAIEAAFDIWSDVTPLEFTEVGPSVDANIYISFEYGDHGDDNPFDGPGGVLAHAFPPGAGYGGDVHFDEAENFTINGAPGIDLFQIAAHELGHSLGLNHSTDAAALMFPYYNGFIPNFQLPQDDINGIQSIYGPNPDAPTTILDTDAPTSTPENQLDGNEPCICIRRKPMT